MNGDSVSGYRVYLDDGFGGPFTEVYDGKNFPSTYEFTVPENQLTCGRRYSVQVTAQNVAGEGSYIEE
jgi:hypothetical protein